LNSLIAIIVKELNLIRTQKAALALIFIYPLLIIASLGVAFGIHTEIQSVNAAIYIPQDIEIESFDRQDLLDMILDTNKVNLIVTNSEEEVIQLIKSRESKLGLIVGGKRATSGQLMVDLYVDNSNPVVSGIFSPIAKTAIKLTALKISAEIIQELWDELLPAKDDVVEELGKIDDYLADLEEGGQKIADLEESVNAIDLDDLSASLEEQRGAISSTESSLQQFSSDYYQFKADIGDTKQQIDDAQASLADYKAEVELQRASLEDTKAELDSISADLEAIIATPGLPPDLVATFTDFQTKVDGAKVAVDDSIAGLDAVEADLVETERQLNEMEQKIDEAEATLDSEKAELDRLSSSLDDTTGNITEMNAQLSTMGDTLDEVISLIEEAKESKDEVSANLTNSKEIFGGFKETLSKLSKFEPSFLSHPIWAFEKYVYPEMESLSFIVPVSLAIMLILTCMLLTSTTIIVERKAGAHLRMKMSPTNATTLVLGKITGQIILAFLVASLILVLAMIKIPLPFTIPGLGTDYIGFGAQFTINIVDLVVSLLVVSVSFISIGLFLTNFAKTESTAILLSLIIMLPMLFLSGVILPVEFMSPAIQTVSPYLPLTLANTMLSEVLVKGTSIVSLVAEIIILLAMSIAMIAYSIVKY